MLKWFKRGNLDVVFDMSDCALCDRKKLTRCYYEDDVVWIVDCFTCQIPIIVLKRHTMMPTAKELAHMDRVLDFLFPKRRLRGEQRQIKEHLHWHILLEER